MNVVTVDPLGVSPVGLSHDERLDLLAAIEQTRAALDAQQQFTLALLAREGDAEARERQWVREEVAAVLRVAPGTAAAKLCDATTLVHRLPRTLDRLVDGSITMLHARTLIEACRALDEPTVAAVEARVLPKADTQPVGIFRQSVKRAVLALDPRTGEQQHEQAHAERRVSLRADEHGMAGVYGYVRADAAAALWAALDTHARALPADGRTMDQKRADVFADLAVLALNAAPGTRQGQRPAVQVTVALSTLIGLDEQPGELAGYGPIPAALARAIAHDPTGTWRRVVTDPIGRLIRYGRRTYRPPAALRDHVITLHATCTFPGCRRQARTAELDHIHPFLAGGDTDPDNMHPACKRHHDAKHLAGWTVSKAYAGTVTWTSPTGRAFDTEPMRYPIDTTRDPPPSDARNRR
jgi:hypothetical protein